MRPAPASAAGRARALAAAAVAAACIAGCGSAASHPAPARPPAVPPSLDTSAVTAGGTWAAIVMGGSSAQNNAFGQLFVRPAGTSTWKLVTPPGVATNGGLVLAGQDGRSLLAGFRPGVDLTFSPLTTTSDDGTHWSAASLIQAGLADVPDALAAAPGSGPLLALAQGGTAEESGNQRRGLDPAGHRTVPGRVRGGPAMQPDHADRRLVHPGRRAAGRRDLRPPRRGRHIRPVRRHLAGRRPRSSRPPSPARPPRCSG